MRHAQSDDFAQSRDFERPLSARGQQDAAHMRHWFHAHGYHPQSALVSAAKRTAKTYDLLQLKNCPAFFFKNSLSCPRSNAADCSEKGYWVLGSYDWA